MSAHASRMARTLARAMRRSHNVLAVIVWSLLIVGVAFLLASIPEAMQR